MKIARNISAAASAALAAAIIATLGASLLLSGTAAAQPTPPSTIDEPRADERWEEPRPRQRLEDADRGGRERWDEPDRETGDDDDSWVPLDRGTPQRQEAPDSDARDRWDAPDRDPRAPRYEPRFDPRERGHDPGRDARDRRRDSRGSSANDQPRLLEDALARYRDIERRGGWKKFPTDLSMGPGYAYDCRRVAALERRMIIEGYLERGSTPPPPRPAPPVPGAPPPPQPPRDEPLGQGGPCKYTSALADAVRAFQADRKVRGDGQVGVLTFAELNRPVGEIVEILTRDVARWRDVTLDASGTYLLVNIPFFELIAYESGREALRMNVITGQPAWQTPLFSDELEFIIVNPDWGIPDSIAKQETWPLAKRDPGYFKREGISASEGGGLRQKPGPRNPLGRIKFMMPNPHNVYLHDTPHKEGFTYPSRSFSHGCVRLHKPLDLAHYLLRDDPEWSPRRLDAAIASKATQRINLRRHMPVHIVYSTSRVNDEGRVELRPDIYGKNGKRARVEEQPPGANKDLLDTGP